MKKIHTAIFIVACCCNGLATYAQTAAHDSLAVADSASVYAYDRISARPDERFLPPADNFTRILEGQATGLQTTNGGGQPGSVAGLMIRGLSTANGRNTPLIILDGAVYTGDLNAINVSDIASIRVLKDAAASVQYGGRSANGVIEIRTRTGNRDHKLQLDVDASAGLVTRALPDYKVIDNPKDYYKFAWNSWRNTLLDLGLPDNEARAQASDRDPSQRGAVGLLNVNPYDVPDNQLIDPSTGEIIPSARLRYEDGNWKKALQRAGLRHEYSMAASDAGKIGDFRLSGGYLNEDGYIKSTGFERLNGRFNGEVHPFRWIRAGIYASGMSATQNVMPAGQANPFYAMRFMAPVFPVYYHNADGSTEIDPATGKKRFSYISNTTGLGDINPLAALELDTHISKVNNVHLMPYIEATMLKQLTFRMQFTYDGTTIRNTETEYSSKFIYQSGQHFANRAWNPTVRWSKQIGKHAAVIQTGYERFNSKVNYSDSSYVQSVSSGYSMYRDEFIQENYFGSGNYNFAERYFVSGGYSKQHSSFLIPSLKWLSYWSVGLGWQISEEKFMKNLSWLSRLNIRGSYGKQGDLNNFSFDQPVFTPVLTAFSPINLGSTFLPPSIHQLDLGADVSLWQQRLNITADYFIKTANDTTVFLPLPSVGGLTIANRGIELSIHALWLRKAGISWETGLNLTHYRNVITHMDIPIYMGRGWIKEGNSLLDFYLIESAGVDPDNGHELFYYTDYKGDKSITADHRIAQDSGWVNMGSALPKIFGSLSNSIQFGNFSCSFLLSFSLGGKYYDRVYQQLMDGNYLQTNVSTDMLQSWTPEQKDSKIPASSVLSDIEVSDRFLRDASYLNFRRLQLSYTVPEAKAKKIKLRYLQFYLSADNIYLLAGHRGMDPQAAFSNDPLWNYNPARTILLGLKLGL